MRTALWCIVTAGLVSIVSWSGTALGIEMTLQDVWSTSSYGPVTRLASDTSNHLLIGTVSFPGSLVKLNDSGQLLESLTSFDTPGAVAVVPGYYFISDQRGVTKIAPDGSAIFAVGGSDTFFVNPHDVAVAPSGRIFVADGDDFIKVFDPQGNYLFQVGGRGWFNGRMNVPVALAVDGVREELVVADQNNYRIQVFNFDGDSLRRFGSIGNGDYSPSHFLRLWGTDIDRLGRIWTYDAILDAIQVFDPQGNFLFMCRVDIPGFHGAVDLALDGDRLYLTAPATESIYVFDILDDSPEPPTAEFNLTIAPVEGEIQLRWDRVEGAETYHLYRSSTIQFESQNTVDLGAVTDTFYLDAEAVQQYDWRFYRIDAVMLPGVCNIPEIPSGPPLLNDPRREASLVTHHDEPHNVANGVNCASCHYTHYPYPEPFPSWWFGEHLCKSCHVETGMSQAQQNHLAGNNTIFCNACHDPHDQQQPFGHYFIRDVVLTPNSGWRSVTFADATDFVHGSPDYDGICEVCHTQTLYYRNNASGDHDHHAGEDCMTCHSHEHGFSTPAD